MALNESLRVDFGETATQALSIERHQETNASGFIAPSFATLGAPFVYLRLYPAVLAKLRATVGTVEQEGVRTADIPGEAVMFRGSDVAQTQHPVHSGLTLDWEGLTFDADGNPLSVSVTADSIGQLRASEPFWGAAIVSYTTQFRLLKYSYEVTALNPSVIGGGGSRITGGTVLAFHQGQVASFDLPPPEMPSPEPDQGEVYRDVSYAILQDGEAWERPPNWPEETWDAGSPDPDETWTEVERVHAQGKMEGFCRLAIERNDVRAAKPWKNSNNYQIPIERIITEDEALAERGFGAGCIAKAKDQIPADLG